MVELLLDCESHGCPTLLALSPIENEFLPLECRQKVLRYLLDFVLLFLGERHLGLREEVEEGEFLLGQALGHGALLLIR